MEGAGKRLQTQNKPITPHSAPPPAKSKEQKELGPENKGWRLADILMSQGPSHFLFPDSLFIDFLEFIIKLPDCSQS